MLRKCLQLMSFLEVGQALKIMFARPQSKDASVTQATRAEKAKYFQLVTYRFLFFKMEESQELK